MFDRIGVELKNAAGYSRSITCLTGLLLLLSAGSASADECDFIAMLAPDGMQLANVELTPDAIGYQNFLRAKSSELGDNGIAINNDGYGVLYYNLNPIILANQKFYATGTDNVWYGHNDNNRMNQAFDAINNSNNHAVIALGHARNSTGAVGSHPFTFERNGKTYSFEHNGDLTAELMQVLLEGMIDSGWSQNLPFTPPNRWGNWYGNLGDYSTWIDSELLFHYLMAYIDEAEGDVFTGLFNALNETNYNPDANGFNGFNVKEAVTVGSPSPDNVINFVLSDGQGLYVYKNAVDSDNTHEIAWRVHDSGLVGVKTENEMGYNTVNQYNLVMIPRKGNVSRFTDMYTFTGENQGVVEARKYHSGSNWVCFPVLPTIDGYSPAQVFAPLSDGSITTSMSLENEGHQPAEWNGLVWNTGEILTMESTKGYKLNILEGNYTTYNHLMAGSERIAPNTEISLQPGWNDVPYFLEESQHPSEAFPQEVLDVLLSINGEYWFMVQRNGEFLVKRVCGSYPKGFECYTLQYGAMYQVYVTQPVTFQWNPPIGPAIPYEAPVTEHFQPEKQPDYIPVVIEDIEGDTGIAEIGVIQNGVCVGAEVVDGYPINLQVYTDDLSTVQFVYADADGLLLPAGQGETVAGAGKRLAVQTYERTQSGAAVITLARGIGDADQPTDFRILSAHPNPFNPTTTLRILLPEAGVIRLDIYNLAGQMVATLVDGHLQAGVHELGWNGQVDDGTAAASGIYYGVFSHGTERSTVKLLLVK